MKKFVVFVVMAALLAGGGWYWWTMRNGDAAQESAAAPSEMPPPAVSVMTLETQKIHLTHSLPGRVSPYRQSQVRPQVDGIITERLFEEGADVEKGQQLYQIDDARYKAALNSAIADLKSAQANVKSVKARAQRYEELVGSGAVSRQEYDDVRATLDQANAAIAVAQADVDLARVDLGYTKVYAPISGRISRSFITEGALVTANQDQHLAVITQIDPVYIDMQQSGDDAMKLRARMAGMETVPVRLTLDAQTGMTYPHEGALKFSEVTVDETAGSITLRALMPNPDGVLLSGLFVRATLDLGEGEALLVPQRAATRMPNGALTVWVVDGDGKAQNRTVEVERAHGDDWIVKSGLKPGDTVIVSGYMKVGPGAPVNAVPWRKSGDDAAPAGKDGQTDADGAE